MNCLNLNEKLSNCGPSWTMWPKETFEARGVGLRSPPSGCWSLPVGLAVARARARPEVPGSRGEDDHTDRRLPGHTASRPSRSRVPHSLVGMQRV
jgi:hypothetical protein